MGLLDQTGSCRIGHREIVAFLDDEILGPEQFEPGNREADLAKLALGMCEEKRCLFLMVVRGRRCAMSDRYAGPSIVRYAFMRPP